MRAWIPGVGGCASAFPYFVCVVEYLVGDSVRRGCSALAQSAGRIARCVIIFFSHISPVSQNESTGTVCFLSSNQNSGVKLITLRFPLPIGTGTCYFEKRTQVVFQNQCLRTPLYWFMVHSSYGFHENWVGVIEAWVSWPHWDLEDGDHTGKATQKAEKKREEAKNRPPNLTSTKLILLIWFTGHGTAGLHLDVGL